MLNKYKMFAGKKQVLSAKEIRTGFIEFFKEHDHEFIPSSPIVPINDDTLLFANAGMNQFKDIFLGFSQPQCKRAANSQKCLRVSGKHNDLEEVGRDTYHHTFFEMLGNWSFDDYFKAEAIEWAWKLFIDVWQIDPEKLWVTVFAGDKDDNLPKDEKAEKLWTKVTPINPERVLSFGKKDNFWEMGASGPCGPCSEIHIDLGEDRCDKKDVPGHKCAVNAGCSRFIELWNLVFIQYNRGTDGKLSPLSAHYIDTGAGLERLVAVLQNKKSNYDTDLFMPVINALSDMSGHKYTSKLHNKTDNAFRVIADHIRALTFAITDGANPSNDGRGYVIRRILRRAARFGRELGMHEPFMYKLVPVVVDYLGDAFNEIKQSADHVTTVIESEEKSFGRTLDRGIEIFNSAAKRAQKASEKTIAGQDAFQLYDTYGFPIDLTSLMAEERGLKVDNTKFNELMEEQRQRARAAQKDASFLSSLTNVELPKTEDIHKYSLDNCASILIGFVDSEGFKTEGTVSEDKELALVLDKTCFYAESGGQVGDCGMIETENGKFVVEKTTKMGDCVLHCGHIIEGNLSVGQTANAKVSKDRDSIRKNHTATHLLQWALQTVVGSSVAQQGSLVCPDYLRFDFTSAKALSNEQIKEVEDLIQEKIRTDLPVNSLVMAREDAEKSGAMALFGEKYGSEVRVIAIGTDDDKLDEAFSKELCGGTHVQRTSDIGNFKIIKEESVSAGVRRITALTGDALNNYLNQRSDIIDQLSALLKVPAEEIANRTTQLIKDNKKLIKELKSAAKQSGNDVLDEVKTILEKAEKINDTTIITTSIESATVDQLRTAIDMIKKKAKSAAVVFGSAENGKAMLLVGVTDDLVSKGLLAGNIIKQIAPIVGGGGGGRPQMAQAGGKDPGKLNDALSEANKLIKEKLSS